MNINEIPDVMNGWNFHTSYIRASIFCMGEGCKKTDKRVDCGRINCPPFFCPLSSRIIWPLTLPCGFIVTSTIVGRACFLHIIDAGFGHMTCVGRWNIKWQHTSTSLNDSGGIMYFHGSTDLVQHDPLKPLDQRGWETCGAELHQNCSVVPRA